MNLLSSIFLLIATLVIVGGALWTINYIQNYELEFPEIDEQICNDAGGRWNSCGSKCQILNAGNPEIACLTVCEALCECGTIAGLECPLDYNCVMPSGISDAQGFCQEKN